MPSNYTPITPGEILMEEFMKPLNVSRNKLARDIDVPVARISEIVRAKRAITADTALRLGAYFNTTPEFWINLQTRHDLKIARRKLQRTLHKTIRPLKAA